MSFRGGGGRPEVTSYRSFMRWVHESNFEVVPLQDGVENAEVDQMPRDRAYRLLGALERERSTRIDAGGDEECGRDRVDEVMRTAVIDVEAALNNHLALAARMDATLDGGDALQLRDRWNALLTAASAPHDAQLTIPTLTDIEVDEERWEYRARVARWCADVESSDIGQDLADLAVYCRDLAASVEREYSDERRRRREEITRRWEDTIDAITRASNEREHGVRQMRDRLAREAVERSQEVHQLHAPVGAHLPEWRQRLLGRELRGSSGADPDVALDEALSELRDDLQREEELSLQHLDKRAELAMFDAVEQFQRWAEAICTEQSLEVERFDEGFHAKLQDASELAATANGRLVELERTLAALHTMRELLPPQVGASVPAPGALSARDGAWHGATARIAAARRQATQLRSVERCPAHIEAEVDELDLQLTDVSELLRASGGTLDSGADHPVQADATMVEESLERLGEIEHRLAELVALWRDSQDEDRPRREA